MLNRQGGQNVNLMDHKIWLETFTIYLKSAVRFEMSVDTDCSGFLNFGCIFKQIIVDFFQFLGAQVTEGTNKRQIIDITLPQRTNAASHRSNHFLTFSRTSQESELHYNLSAFGRVFEFELRPEKSFIAPSFSVEHCSGNLSQSIPSGVDLSHCFYRGSVRNDPVSSAVFDLCNGMVSFASFDANSCSL